MDEERKPVVGAPGRSLRQRPCPAPSRWGFSDDEPRLGARATFPDPRETSHPSRDQSLEVFVPLGPPNRVQDRNLLGEQLGLDQFRLRRDPAASVEQDPIMPWQGQNVFQAPDVPAGEVKLERPEDFGYSGAGGDNHAGVEESKTPESGDAGEEEGTEGNLGVPPASGVNQTWPNYVPMADKTPVRAEGRQLSHEMREPSLSSLRGRGAELQFRRQETQPELEPGTYRQFEQNMTEQSRHSSFYRTPPKKIKSRVSDDDRPHQSPLSESAEKVVRDAYVRAYLDGVGEKIDSAIAGFRYRMGQGSLTARGAAELYLAVVRSCKDDVRDRGIEGHPSVARSGLLNLPETIEQTIALEPFLSKYEAELAAIRASVPQGLFTREKIQAQLDDQIEERRRDVLEGRWPSAPATGSPHLSFAAGPSPDVSTGRPDRQKIPSPAAPNESKPTSMFGPVNPPTPQAVATAAGGRQLTGPDVISGKYVLDGTAAIEHQGQPTWVIPRFVPSAPPDYDQTLVKQEVPRSVIPVSTPHPASLRSGLIAGAGGGGSPSSSSSDDSESTTYQSPMSPPRRHRSPGGGRPADRTHTPPRNPNPSQGPGIPGVNPMVANPANIAASAASQGPNNPPRPHPKPRKPALAVPLAQGRKAPTNQPGRPKAGVARQAGAALKARTIHAGQASAGVQPAGKGAGATTKVTATTQQSSANNPKGGVARPRGGAPTPSPPPPPTPFRGPKQTPSADLEPMTLEKLSEQISQMASLQSTYLAESRRDSELLHQHVDALHSDVKEVWNRVDDLTHDVDRAVKFSVKGAMRKTEQRLYDQLNSEFKRLALEHGSPAIPSSAPSGHQRALMSSQSPAKQSANQVQPPLPSQDVRQNLVFATTPQIHGQGGVPHGAANLGHGPRPGSAYLNTPGIPPSHISGGPPPQQYSPAVGDSRTHQIQSALSRYGSHNSYANVLPAMKGNRVAADSTPRFSHEIPGITLKDWLDELFNQSANYNWSSEQVARLIIERATGRAKAALDLLSPLQRTDLGQIVVALEDEFYSVSQQQSTCVAFSRRMRKAGESERTYAYELMILARYAYKDMGQLHMENRCREQFLAGLRSHALCTHLTVYCHHLKTVRELVTAAETFRACHENSDILSDSEPPTAPTIAAVKSRPPGPAQKARKLAHAAIAAETKRKAYQKPASAPPGNHTPSPAGNKPKYQRFQRAKPENCSGRCCYKCGKEGHFIRDCGLTSQCVAVMLGGQVTCEDPNHQTCKCECGEHQCFVNDADYNQACLSRKK